MNAKRVTTSAVSLTLALSMIAGMAGCSPSSSSSNSASKASSSTSSSTAETKANTMPIASPAGSYSFTLFADDSNTTDEWMLPYLEKQTGVKVKVERYPYDVAKEKLPLALNSGSYADCIGGWTLSQSDILTYGVDQKVYIPLEDYFKKYCPNIEKILAIPGVKEQMTAPDGHIYSIPYVLDAPKVDFAPVINKKWLDKVGLSVPKTTDEFEAALKAFKTKDPNGNGKADEIPFSCDPNNKDIGYLAGYFGVSVAGDGFTMDGDKLAFGANTPQYKSFIEWMAKLYSEGLIDNEIFTQDLAHWKAKGKQNLYGCSIAYGCGDFTDYQNTSGAPDYVAVPALTSPSCSKPVFLANTDGYSVYNSQVVITDKAKNPELICRWWDNLYNLENSVQSQWGPIGKTVEKTSDGSYKSISSTLSKADQDKYGWANMWIQSLPHYIPLGYKLKEDKPTYDEKAAIDKTLEPNLTKTMPISWVGTADATTYADTYTAVKNFVQQKQAQWISGQSNVDKDWDAYCKQLDNLGLQKLISMRQKGIVSTASK